MRGERIVWAGGEHLFFMGLGELRALEKSRDCSAWRVLARLSAWDGRVDDVIEPVRLGLIGGGEVAEREAGQMVTRLAESHGLPALVPTAVMVLTAALTGPEDDPVGKTEAGEAETTSSASPASTETAP